MTEETWSNRPATVKEITRETLEKFFAELKQYREARERAMIEAWAERYRKQQMETLLASCQPPEPELIAPIIRLSSVREVCKLHAMPLIADVRTPECVNCRERITGGSAFFCSETCEGAYGERHPQILAWIRAVPHSTDAARELIDP